MQNLNICLNFRTSQSCVNPVTNWSMLEELGARLKPNSLQYSIKERNLMEIPILVTPDFCHLLKLVGNCFAKHPGLFSSLDVDTINLPSHRVTMIYLKTLLCSRFTNFFNNISKGDIRSIRVLLNLCLKDHNSVIRKI